MSRRVCPLCDQAQDCDQAAFEYHVNSHLNDPRSHAGSMAVKSDRRERSPFDDAHAASNGNGTCCPICSYPFNGLSESQQAVHVNSCIDAQTEQAESTMPQIHRRRTRSGQLVQPRSRPDPRANVFDDDDMAVYEDDEDFVVPTRVNGSGENGRTGSGRWTGPARPDLGTHGSAGSDRTGHGIGKVEKWDEWYDALHGSTKMSDLPSNISPGICSALLDILKASVNQYTTRKAVICRDTTYLRGVWSHDMGWSCGYRNALMLISSLSQHNNHYRQAFSRDATGVQPGVRSIQKWMTEAWDAGFDPEGEKHFGGKIKGSREWVGTADVAAMMLNKGIDAKLYDFPKCRSGSGQTRPHPNKLLVDWMIKYFDEGIDDPDWRKKGQARVKPANAFDAIMQSKDDCVKRSERYPVMLQHDGHSRTVVGYEIDGKGNPHLLVLDPGKSGIATSVRMTGFRYSLDERAARLSALQTAGGGAVTKPPTGPTRKPSFGILTLPRGRRSSDQTHEKPSFSRPYTNGASAQVGPDTALFSPIAPSQTSRMDAKAKSKRGAPGSGWTATGAFADNKRGDENQSGRPFHDQAKSQSGEGWMKKGLNKIRSADLAPGKVLKKIRSDSTGSSEGYEEIEDDGAAEGLLPETLNQRNSGGSHPRAKATSKGGPKGGQEWKSAAKLLKSFRAELNPVIGAPSEYQVLAVPTETFLDQEQRQRYKILDSKVIA